MYTDCQYKGCDEKPISSGYCQKHLDQIYAVKNVECPFCREKLISIDKCDKCGNELNIRSVLEKLQLHYNYQLSVIREALKSSGQRKNNSKPYQGFLNEITK